MLTTLYEHDGRQPQQDRTAAAIDRAALASAVVPASRGARYMVIGILADLFERHVVGVFRYPTGSWCSMPRCLSWLGREPLMGSRMRARRSSNSSNSTIGDCSCTAHRVERNYRKAYDSAPRGRRRHEQGSPARYWASKLVKPQERHKLLPESVYGGRPDFRHQELAGNPRG